MRQIIHIGCGGRVLAVRCDPVIRQGHVLRCLACWQEPLAEELVEIANEQAKGSANLSCRECRSY